MRKKKTNEEKWGMEENEKGDEKKKESTRGKRKKRGEIYIAIKKKKNLTKRKQYPPLFTPPLFASPGCLLLW